MIKMPEVEFSDARNASFTSISEQPENINKTQVSFPDWKKLDLRVAKILKVEDIEGADNLYKLEIDVGKLGKRVICAGIKKFYKKEQLKGKKIILLANLKPRTLKGIESQGMLLAAGSKEKNICVLISPENVPNDTKIS